MEQTAPYFDIMLTWDYFNNHGRAKAEERVEKDLIYQAWEITDIPLADPFRLIKKQINGVTKLIAECDALDGSNLDLLEITSQQIRRGREYQAVCNIRKACLEAPVNSTILQFSPAKDQSESIDECNYPKAQVNVIYRVGEDLSIQHQIQAYLDIDQVISLRHKLTQKSLEIKENDTPLDSLITSVETIDSFLNISDIMAQITAINGQRFASAAVIEDQKWQIQTKARASAHEFLDVLGVDSSTENLNSHYKRLLAQTLPDKFLAEVVVSGVSLFNTSCGGLEITLPEFYKRRSLISCLFINFSEYRFGFCQRCFQHKAKVGSCLICFECETTQR